MCIETSLPTSTAETMRDRPSSRNPKSTNAEMRVDTAIPDVLAVRFEDRRPHAHAIANRREIGRSKLVLSGLAGSRCSADIPPHFRVAFHRTERLQVL